MGIILMLFLFIINNTQEEYCVKVIDKKTKDPISYASIYLEKTKEGLYSNEEGGFCISNTEDSVTITAMGFEKLKLSAHSLLSNSTIELNPKPIILKEAIIKPRKAPNNYTIGYWNKNILSEYSYNPNSGFLLATFIPSETEGQIKQVSFQVSPNKKSYIKSYKVRLHIYEDNININLPGEEILNENIIMDVENSTKKIVFDINDNNIMAPKNGFWVGIESIGYYIKNGDYFIIDNRKYGFNNKKSNKKVSGTLSPSYVYKKVKNGRSAVSYFNNKWSLEKYAPNLVFCSTVQIEK